MKAALTYAEAQMRIDDPSMTDAVTKSLRNLNRLAKILKKKRMEKGWDQHSGFFQCTLNMYLHNLYYQVQLKTTFYK